MIDEKQYSNFSLEELRKMQENHQIRKGTRQVTEKEKEYWGKVFETSQNKALQSIAFVDLACDDVKPEIAPWMSYDEAKAQFYDCMKRIGKRKGYRWDFYPDLKDLCSIMAAYFSGNQIQGIDLHKGFFISGPCGCGKTELFRSAQLMSSIVQVPGRFFKTIDTERIMGDYLRSYDGFFTDNWYFDDLGNTSLVKKEWGNEINPMQQIFSRRSRNMQSRYLVTHVSSNVRPESFGPSGGVPGIFDDRVISRWKEMFNFISIDGPDYR